MGVSYDRLRTMRKMKGFRSVERLAEASGISKSHLSDIETGKANPSVLVVCRLAKILGCRPEELYECKEVEHE